MPVANKAAYKKSNRRLKRKTSVAGREESNWTFIYVFGSATTFMPRKLEEWGYRNA